LVCLYTTLLRSSFGKISLKQVAQYPSYLILPLRLSIQSMQLGHLLPPPCLLHLTIKPLGRWTVNENKNHNLFIDYANEDNCGNCQDYLNNKIQQRKTITEIEKNLAIEYASMVVNTPN